LKNPAEKKTGVFLVPGWCSTPRLVGSICWSFKKGKIVIHCGPFALHYHRSPEKDGRFWIQVVADGGFESLGIVTDVVFLASFLRFALGWLNKNMKRCPKWWFDGDLPW